MSKTRSRAVISMLPLRCHGFIAVDEKGNVPYECTREHPELPRGFPLVWRHAASVRKPYVAQKVEVVLTAVHERRASVALPSKELTGTVNSESPDSEKEEGGAK